MAKIGLERADLKPQWPKWDTWIEGQTERRLEIHPCILKVISPIGPLPKKELCCQKTFIW